MEPPRFAAFYRFAKRCQGRRVGSGGPDCRAIVAGLHGPACDQLQAMQTYGSL
jgi:hypothetical protein